MPISGLPRTAWVRRKRGYQCCEHKAAIQESVNDRDGWLQTVFRLPAPIAEVMAKLRPRFPAWSNVEAGKPYGVNMGYFALTWHVNMGILLVC
jgi:hypothetical protein